MQGLGGHSVLADQEAEMLRRALDDRRLEQLALLP
jgi:hypothetical protein